MNAVQVTAAALWGILLGAIFFGGLWLTVQRLEGSRRPHLLIVGSFLARSLLAMGGFYLLSGDGLPRLMIALVGFFLARILITRRLQPSMESREGVGEL